MAEFINIPIQEVSYGQAVQLNVRKACTKGYIMHREGAGIVTLKGPSSGCCCNTSARYSVTFNGNIAVPEGGTIGEISVAIAIAGEPDGASLAAYTPTVVDTYGNVTSTTQIDVPRSCCVNIAVENTSATLGSINVRNANLVVSRIG